MEEAKKTGFWQFYLAYSIIVIAFFDNFTLLPIISPFATVLGATVFMASVIVATYSFANMIGNFFAGFFMNKIGRINTIVAGLLVGSLGVFSYSLVQDPQQLLFVRIIHGLGMAIVVPSVFALIGDLSSQDSRGKSMAKSGIAISLAAVTGPPIGGLIKSYLFIDIVFYFVAGVLIVGAVICKLTLKETASEVLEQQEQNNEKAFSKEDLISLFGQMPLIIAYMAAFFLMVAKGTLATILPLYVEKLGYTAAVTGFLFTCYALASIIVFVVISKIPERKERFTPIILGLLFISLSLGLIGFGKTLTILVPIMLLYGVGFGFLFTASTALVVDTTNVQTRGYGFGIFYGIFSLGVVIGPVVTGYLETWIHPFSSASLILAIGIALIIFTMRKYKLKTLEVN